MLNVKINDISFPVTSVTNTIRKETAPVDVSESLPKKNFIEIILHDDFDIEEIVSKLNDSEIYTITVDNGKINKSFEGYTFSDAFTTIDPILVRTLVTFVKPLKDTKKDTE